jgi:hypothetical protein
LLARDDVTELVPQDRQFVLRCVNATSGSAAAGDRKRVGIRNVD